MYLRFFNLEKQPFGITPDPHFLYLSATHREALAALVYGINQRKGFISITGDAGTGKTLILRAFLERIDPARTKAFFFLNPLISFEQIIDEMLSSGEADDRGPSERLHSLQKQLVHQFRAGRNVVLVFDEAQRMPPDTLEKLRILSNLETSEDKLVQIVLAGQPELERKLAGPGLQQLQQRVAVRARIGPLSAREGVEYVRHRILKAKGRANEVFTKAALRKILRHAKGNPRAVNVLCDNVLLASYGLHRKPVARRVVNEVIADNFQRDNRWRLVLRGGSAVAGTVALAIFAGSQLLPLRESGTTGAATGQIAVLEAQQRAHQSGSPFSDQPLEGNFDAIAEKKFTNRLHEVAVSAKVIDADESTVDGANEGEPSDEFLARVVVGEGDGLWSLSRAVYGFVNEDVIRSVLASNQQIVDPDTLAVGDELVFLRLPSDHLTASR